MDAALKQLENGGWDIFTDGADLKKEEGLRSAVIVSLFTDRRADADDEIPDGTNDRRGTWSDAFAETPGDIQGSKLWLLDRSKATQQTLDRAKDYATEALQWFISDGVASSLQVETYWLRSGVMAIEIVIKQGQKTLFNDIFNYELTAA